MPKLHECTPGQYCFWCVGCECAHHIYTDGRVNWVLTGGVDSPTVTPSLLHNKGEKGAQCHYVITDGKQVFFLDTFHQYRSQTVEIPEWDERIHNRYSIRPRHERNPMRNRSPKTNMVCSFNFEKD